VGFPIYLVHPQLISITTSFAIAERLGALDSYLSIIPSHSFHSLSPIVRPSAHFISFLFIIIFMFAASAMQKLLSGGGNELMF
jgi:hypothetical protein